MQHSVAIKADVLSKGVNIDASVYDNYGYPYLVKRRGYGNQDPLEIKTKTIPQEIILDSKVIVAVNVRFDSPWTLHFKEQAYFLIHEKDGIAISVDFPKHPAFYDKKMSNDQNVNQIVSLYGGRSLGFFVYGSCSLVKMGKTCHYCSIDVNRNKQSDFEHVIKPWQLRNALQIALENSPDTVNQVMINGGNFTDLDKSFIYYTDLALEAKKVIDESQKDIEIHLIVFPPEDLSLIHRIKDKGIKVAMNTEIYDTELYEKYCPGKVAIYGQKRFLKALKEAVSILGKGNVYSLLLGGLEPLESTKKGLEYLASIGVIPIINVFHPDPGTPLEYHKTATKNEILELGKMLQEVYKKNDFIKPFYDCCGRNSLDTEAYYQLFGD